MTAQSLYAVTLTTFYLFFIIFLSICVALWPPNSSHQNKRCHQERKLNKATHCLFDMDGTLLDSEIIYHRTIKKICERYGRIYHKKLQNQMYGVTDHQLSVGIVRELNLPLSVYDFEMQMTEMVKKCLPSAPLKDGAERLLRHLNDYKIPFALVTNSTDHAVRMHASARPELFGLFHHKVCITDADVFRGKPHPDIYLIAASRFTSKPHPNECLVFEDSTVGVQAAVEAGMQVIMIPDQRLKRDFTRNATLVLRSLLDFKPELFGLPPFKDDLDKIRRLTVIKKK